MQYDRMIFDTDSDPGIQVVNLGLKSLSFSCQDDWCGDTFSGFGATVNVELSAIQVEQLRDALSKWLAAAHLTLTRID